MPGDELVAFEGEEHEETFVVPQASLCCVLSVCWLETRRFALEGGEHMRCVLSRRQACVAAPP